MSVQDRGPLAIDEEDLLLALDQIPVGYQALDEDGNLIAVNQTWCRILGYASNPVMSNFRDFGFCDAIKKPFKADEIIQAVKRQLAIDLS